MNEGLLDFLRKSEVKRLPEDKRKLYEFITEAENALADKATTVDEFFSLVLADSPVNSAMARFGLPYLEIVMKLMEIEEELHIRIEQRAQRVKWIDFSGNADSRSDGEGQKQLFLFIH
ncbi:hypothetical protein ACTL32_10640 [Planococcus sp. FY231025]|uniref:hypothetical protein n=1 Tax=Planococcus sp. FY231025 TaxID=3455699 RepID=UPI003F92E52F